MMKKLSLLRILFLTLICCVVIGGSRLAQAADRQTIVVFNANWCASCREIIPVVQEVGSQNGIRVQILDVDSQSAPAQARSYGLSIPTRGLPQVFLIQNGTVKPLFDGQGYVSGQTNLIRSTILQNLQ